MNHWPVIDEHQLDITEDGFMSLMTDNGDTKDDVKVPDNEVGEKINQMWGEDKDCSKSQQFTNIRRDHD
jgi:hypothetical protein